MWTAMVPPHLRVARMNRPGARRLERAKAKAAGDTVRLGIFAAFDSMGHEDGT